MSVGKIWKSKLDFIRRQDAFKPPNNRYIIEGAAVYMVHTTSDWGADREELIGLIKVYTRPLSEAVVTSVPNNKEKSRTKIFESEETLTIVRRK